MSDGAPLIELAGIGKSYRSGDEGVLPVLRDVSLVIHPGEFVAIMGASGSGKSTLMNILGCLDRPSSGTYRFAGRDVATLDDDALAWLRRQAFGFVFQGYHLIGNATATENVEIPAIYAGVPFAQRRRRAHELLTRLGLGERLDHRPSQLSGGQQQRVSIARALMNGGQVILADEPTGALDSRSGEEVMALLQELSDQGHTIILITHEREVAAHAQRLIELRDGRIVSDSGPVSGSNAPLPVVTGPAAPGRWFSPADTVETVVMALRALRANLFRTLLTLLGIVIGVGSVVAMLAIGHGAKQAVMAQINQMGTNLLVVRPGVPGRRSSDTTNAMLSVADADAIAAVPNVLAVAPEITGTVTVRHGNTDALTQVTATTAEYTLIRNWPPAWGAFFTADDNERYAAVTVLGQTVANKLFADGSNPVGQFVLLKNVPFLVIGVMSAKGATPWGQDSDDVAFVPLSTGSLRLFGQSYLRGITVAVADTAAIAGTEADINGLVRARHAQGEFQVRNMAAIVETAVAAQNTLTLLLGSIAAISLLVGGIGVMNIMLVSVTERTREIGIRKATGARVQHILQQFLTEAVVVSVLGGLVGVLAGIAAGELIALLGMPALFSLPIIALAFGCAAATGLVFGFAPAWKAAHLDPVVALASD